MLAESALSLSMDLPTNQPGEGQLIIYHFLTFLSYSYFGVILGGVFTPSSVMGEPLLKRLRNQGFTFGEKN